MQREEVLQKVALRGGDPLHPRFQSLKILCLSYFGSGCSRSMPSVWARLTLSHSWGCSGTGRGPHILHPRAHGARPAWCGRQSLLLTAGESSLCCHFDTATLLFVAVCVNNILAIFKSCFIWEIWKVNCQELSALPGSTETIQEHGFATNFLPLYLHYLSLW